MKKFNFKVYFVFLFVLLLSGCDEIEDIKAVLSTEKLIGNYEVRKMCEPTEEYSLGISPTLEQDKINIFNLYNLGGYLEASVSNDNDIIIPSQQIGDILIEGTGSFSDDQINFDVTVDDVECELTCTKK